MLLPAATVIQPRTRLKVINARRELQETVLMIQMLQDCAKKSKVLPKMEKTQEASVDYEAAKIICVVGESLEHSDFCCPKYY